MEVQSAPFLSLSLILSRIAGRLTKFFRYLNPALDLLINNLQWVDTETLNLYNLQYFFYIVIDATRYQNFMRTWSDSDESELSIIAGPMGNNQVNSDAFNSSAEVTAVVPDGRRVVFTSSEEETTIQNSNSNATDTPVGAVNQIESEGNDECLMIWKSRMGQRIKMVFLPKKREFFLSKFKDTEYDDFSSWQRGSFFIGIMK